MAEKQPIREGDVIAGKFRVERVIGAGGMGIVVKARHLQLDSDVALKMLHPEVAVDAARFSRFSREARAAARLRGEHVARVTDVGTLDDGAPYMVMEYLEGEDLSAHLTNHGPLPVSAAAEYVIQACDALGEAHGQGIVHRDIKPANLFLVRRPNGGVMIKVLDFGISKLSVADAPGGSVTKTNNVFGTPLYMAPEQMRSTRGVDARADIWSLGVTLYEVLTNRSPFHGETLVETCLKVAQEAPDRPSLLRAEIPAELEAVIMKCLEKSPADRYGDVGELARDLLPFSSRATEERTSGDLAVRTGPHRAASTAIAIARTSESGRPPKEKTDSGRDLADVIAARGLIVGPRMNTPLPPAPAASNTGVTWGQTNDGAPSAAVRRRNVLVYSLAAVAAFGAIGVGYLAMSSPKKSASSAHEEADYSTTATTTTTTAPATPAASAPSIDPALSASGAPSTSASATPSASTTDKPAVIKKPVVVPVAPATTKKDPYANPN